MRRRVSLRKGETESTQQGTTPSKQPSYMEVAVMSEKNPLNYAQVTGRLMKDPFVHETENGRRVGRVLLVVQRPGRSGATNIQLVDWGDDWGASASNPKSREGLTIADLKEGDLVRVEGELYTRSYESTKFGGQRVYEQQVDVRGVDAINEEEHRALLVEATATALA